jgi:hypothetical protein
VGRPGLPHLDARRGLNPRQGTPVRKSSARDGTASLAGLIHYTNAVSSATSIAFTEQHTAADIDVSVGDNALGESVVGLYKTELIKPGNPWRTRNKSNWPPWTTSTGATTEHYSRPAATFRPSRSSSTTTVRTTASPRPDSHQTESAHSPGRLKSEGALRSEEALCTRHA